ncbi:MAG: hypothetical protein R3F35_23425 [Myxococcota bacterium]
MHKWIRLAGVLGLSMSLLSTIMVVESNAQNLVRARMFRGGGRSGPPFGWGPAPASVDTRVWPPACGVKLSQATPSTPCTRPYFGAHPENPVYAQTGMNGGNLTFDANGFDIHFTTTFLGNPGFPVVIQEIDENFGHASFGPGLGAGRSGTITFDATGVDPADIGTQAFTYDPDGLVTPAGPQAFQWPPNAASTTPRPIGQPPNHGGRIRVVTGSQRYGGTLNLVGVNKTFVVQTFNPGVATTGIVPVQNAPGSPVPAVTPTSGFTIPGATLVNRKKAVEINRIRTNMGITPGGFVSVGLTVGSRNTFQMREEGPWTTGMVTVSEMDRPGVFPTTTIRVDTGSRNTVAGVGTIQLVQPYIIRSMNPDGNNATTSTSKLILEIVPEPGASGLIGVGVMGLVLHAGIRRRRLGSR